MIKNCKREHSLIHVEEHVSLTAILLVEYLFLSALDNRKVIKTVPSIFRRFVDICCVVACGIKIVVLY